MLRAGRVRAVKPPLPPGDAAVVLDVARELLYGAESIEDDDVGAAAACLALLPRDTPNNDTETEAYKDDDDKANVNAAAQTTRNHLAALRALADLGLLVRPMELLQSPPEAVVRVTADEAPEGAWQAVVGVGVALGLSWEQAALEVVGRLEERAVEDAQVCVGGGLWRIVQGHGRCCSVMVGGWVAYGVELCWGLFRDSE